MPFSFLQILKEGSGDLSSVRGVMVAWCLGVLLVWGYNSIVAHILSDIPESVVAIIGILVTGKYFQKKIEVKPSECTEEPKKGDKL